MVVLLEAHLDGKQCSPPSLLTLNWRDLISSTWDDTNYKRTAIASLIQAVYWLELDRQENRTQENAQASNYWIPFKYKLRQTLIDERDGSIFGAIFEWDRSTALSDLRPFRPSGAPRAVLALRGTLLRSPTMRRDIEDDLRFVAWESLKGSARYKTTMDALKSVCNTHGSSNVCIAGHSLGAGFGLQVGQELAKERINVEAHLFNPPAVSLAVSLENIGEIAEYVWNIVKTILPSGSEAQASNDGDKTYCMKLERLIARLSALMDESFRTSKWVPHLYVNSNDWISFFYIHTGGTRENINDMRNTGLTDVQNAAKLFVIHKENQKFLEAHGLKQWWSSDAELQQDTNNCKLLSRPLRSLNTGTLYQVVLFYYPHSISLAMSVMNISQMIDFVWNVLKSVPHLISKTQIRMGLGLKGWMPQLSCMNDAVYWVCKWVPYLYVSKNDGTGLNGLITAKFFVVSKKQQKFLAAHGLEQWWPSGAELQDIHNNQFIGRKVSSLYTYTPWVVTEILNPSSGALAMSLSNVGEREEFVWKWNSLKSMLQSSSKAQVSNDGDKTSGGGLKGWMPQLSSMKHAAYWVCKWIPYLYVTKNDGAGETMIEKENMGPPNELISANLIIVSKEQLKFLAAHGLEQWWSSEKELHQSIHNSQLTSRQIRSLCTNTPWDVTQIMNPSSVSLSMSLGSIREREEFVCKWNSLKSVHYFSGKAQVINDGGISSGVGCKGWIPQLSGLKDAAYRVCKSVPYLYVGKNDDTRETTDDKEYMGSTNGETTAKLFVVSKEQQKFLAAHSLEQWWPSDAQLQQAIHHSKIMQFRSSYTSTPWEVTEILNPSSGALAMSFSQIGEREEFVWKWNSLKSMFPSSLKAHVSNDGVNTSDVSMKSWTPSLSGLKDAGFAAGKWVPQAHMYSNCSDYMSKHLGNRLASMCSSSSEARVSNDADMTSGTSLKSWIPGFSGLKDACFGIGKFVPYLHGNKSDGKSDARGEKMVDKENMNP